MTDYNDTELKIRKGQAYNLAVMTACAEGKSQDSEYIAKQFLRHMEFANLLQKTNLEQLENIIMNPKTVELLKNLDENLNNV